ncbi:AAA family ATPase, partial [Klebsiella pneumoniae]
SVNAFALSDFKIFRDLFFYDFSKLEEALSIDCFSTISNYHSIEKQEQRYNKNVSDKVKELSKKIAASSNEKEVFEIVTEFYRQYGVGKFGLN